MALFYLSFADSTDWLGGAIVDVEDAIAASDPTAPARRAWELGCNPGGEIMQIELDATFAATVPDDYIGRLLDKDDIAALGERVEPGGGELITGSAVELGEHAERVGRGRRQ